jgi:hypothetical protein
VARSIPRISRQIIQFLPFPGNMRLDRRHRHLGSSARDQGGKDNHEWYFLTGIGCASEHESEGASQIWGFVSDLLKDPKRLREGLEELVEREREGVQGDPDREAKAWANKLAAADDKRSRLQDMAAEGLITFDELGAKLEALEEEREHARRELEGLEDHRARLR